MTKRDRQLEEYLAEAAEAVSTSRYEQRDRGWWSDDDPEDEPPPLACPSEPILPTLGDGSLPPEDA